MEMVMFKYSILFSARKCTRFVFAVIFGGLLVAACGERSEEAPKPASAGLCTNPSAGLSLPATTLDPNTKRGWNFSGPSFPEQKKNVPMGRFDNHLVVDFSIPAGATAIQLKVQVSGTVATAALILDTVWYSGAKEVGRAAPSVELGSKLSNVISTTQAVPSGADRLMLIVRPWRDIDGIVTVGEGELAWCTK